VSNTDRTGSTHEVTIGLIEGGAHDGRIKGFQPNLDEYPINGAAAAEVDRARWPGSRT